MKPAPTPVTKILASNVNRSIGAILVDSGRLSIEQAEQVLQFQKQCGMRFGEAAVNLGLLTPEDIQQVLAHQYGYPCLRRGQSRISEELVAAYQPYSRPVESLRALRSQLMLRWFAADNCQSKAITVVSPDRGEGRSYLAANLAVVFSQLGESTLLIDADMRNGRQHMLFNVENFSGLSTILAGRSQTAPILRLADLEALSILTAGPVPPNPQELLGRDVLPKLMEKFAEMFDVIIIDTPAAINYADAQTLSARTGGALLVTRQDYTSLDSAGQVSRTLADQGVSVIGAVLNQF